MKSLEDGPDFKFLKHDGLQVDHEFALKLTFESVRLVEIDLTAAAAFIL
jgi:hypothetical protein